jgi:hypothetical protein
MAFKIDRSAFSRDIVSPVNQSRMEPWILTAAYKKAAKVYPSQYFLPNSSRSLKALSISSSETLMIERWLL